MTNKKHEILIEVDQSCQMARVSVDGRFIMEGNFWDFHPGTHGLYLYGNFTCYNSLAGRLYSNMLSCGIAYNEIATIRKEYDYRKEQSVEIVAN